MPIAEQFQTLVNRKAKVMVALRADHTVSLQLLGVDYFGAPFTLSPETARNFEPIAFFSAWFGGFSARKPRHWYLPFELISENILFATHNYF